MLTIPNALPYRHLFAHARRGLLWRRNDAHDGKPGPVFVARASPWAINRRSLASTRRSSGKHEEDLADAAAEYGAEFRIGSRSLCRHGGVRNGPKRACSRSRSRRSIPTLRSSIRRRISDSMTMAIAHRERQTISWM